MANMSLAVQTNNHNGSTLALCYVIKGWNEKSLFFPRPLTWISLLAICKCHLLYVLIYHITSPLVSRILSARAAKLKRQALHAEAHDPSEPQANFMTFFLIVSDSCDVLSYATDASCPLNQLMNLLLFYVLVFIILLLLHHTNNVLRASLIGMHMKELYLILTLKYIWMIWLLWKSNFQVRFFV